MLAISLHSGNSIVYFCPKWLVLCMPGHIYIIAMVYELSTISPGGHDADMRASCKVPYLRETMGIRIEMTCTGF